MRGGSNWFCDKLVTIVSLTKAIMRSGGPDGQVRIRLLRGCELLSFQGWPLEQLNPEDFSEQTLTSLAGNAFSAFAVGVVALGSLPTLTTATAPKSTSGENANVPTDSA